MLVVSRGRILLIGASLLVGVVICRRMGCRIRPFVLVIRLLLKMGFVLGLLVCFFALLIISTWRKLIVNAGHSSCELAIAHPH